MDARLEEAEERIFVVIQSLQEVPLNIGASQSEFMAAKQYD